MILALDTATPFLVLGLLGEGVALERVEEVGRAHAERLAGAVAHAFAQAERPVGAREVVVGVGPGSYTGLRVGASYALGLGRALGARVTGVSTLEAIAGRGDGRVAASLDARKGQVYGGVFRVEGGVVQEVLLPEDKYPLEAFEGHARGAAWLRDVPPGGLALARLVRERGLDPTALRYL